MFNISTFRDDLGEVTVDWDDPARPLCGWFIAGTQFRCIERRGHSELDGINLQRGHGGDEYTACAIVRASRLEPSPALVMESVGTIPMLAHIGGIPSDDQDDEAVLNLPESVSYLSVADLDDIWF